ncbi:uncharacterized protein LOC105702643, partial [Orussus abietinus]|uniref:uncharacterized protein LOC105702643 n=1 Tax=Orussus abietinus TaxID=222816 RepID=UPI000C71613C
NALELLRLDVPSIADPRSEKVVLRCEYDLGGEELYSVKWYKDGMEFFRYMPSYVPYGRDFPVDGVIVDTKRSDSRQVTLLGQSSAPEGKINLAGSYGCEVSSEGPSFLTTYKEANMSVGVLPKRAPVLEGLRPNYQVGEYLAAECTSAPSHPPAKLAFFLNDKEVSKAQIKVLPTLGLEDKIVASSRLGFSIRLERHHFPGGTLSLICRSTLPGISVAKPLETEVTATLAASNQRLAQEPPRSAGPTTWGSFSWTLAGLAFLSVHLIHV